MYVCIYMYICSRRLEVGRHLDDLLVVSFQDLAIQPLENEGDSSCDDTLTLKLVRVQNIVYVSEYSAYM